MIWWEKFHSSHIRFRLEILTFWILLFTLDSIIGLILKLLVDKDVLLLVLEYLMILPHLKIIVLLIYQDVYLALVTLFNFTSIKIFLLEFFHKKKFLVHHLAHFFWSNNFKLFKIILRNLPNLITLWLILDGLFNITIIQKFKLLLLICDVWLLTLNTIHFK